MKTKLTILLVAVSLFTNVMAQDNVWFDVDFSSTEWLDAFKATGYDFTAASPGQPTNMGNAAVTVNNFKVNGNGFREASPITSVCGKEFEYSVRLRQNAETYIEFPEVANVSKVTVYVQNPNTDDYSNNNTLTLQKKNGENWNDADYPGIIPPLKFLLDYEGTSDYELVFEDLNIDEPVTLRIWRNESRFQKVFRIIVEKYDESSSVKSSLRDKTDIAVDRKTLFLSGNVSNDSLSIFDLVGKQVYNCKVNSDKIDLQDINTGVYIVKLNTEQGEITQKVIIE